MNRFPSDCVFVLIAGMAVGLIGCDRDLPSREGPSIPKRTKPKPTRKLPPPKGPVPTNHAYRKTPEQRAEQNYRQQIHKLASPHLPTVLRAIDAVAAHGKKAAPEIRKLIKDPRVDVRSKAVSALGRVGDKSDWPLLGQLLAKDPAPAVRAWAALSIQRLVAYTQVQALLDALSDTDKTVRRYSHKAVSRMAGLEYPFNWDGPKEVREQQAAKIRAKRQMYEYGGRVKYERGQNARAPLPGK